MTHTPSQNDFLTSSLNKGSCDSADTYIKENSQFIKYNKGELIIKQSSPATHAIFVNKGLVKTIKESANGRTNILEIIGKGQHMGLLAVMSSTIHDYTSIALTDVEARFTPKDVFMQIMHENSDLANKIITESCLSSQKTINRLVTINNKQLPGRVADVILYFLELESGESHDSLEFPLTRNELAQFAGTTKESFIRTLTEFKNDKIISINGKAIQINSMEIIKTLSRLG
ncbi:Crp/Fnr family transcriptional regulator [Natronoflexus pectinivorans]|uniref:CRP-like cAMP-binding protein n=1 Tax=Natronoflexus pectinivorans TaxID=682526 RepID=A0A4R2GHR6_9BACT|nr:Crp/Fnr family transcriptional regulator [Natronoflexus pectinivorans]TCO06819.1 CRP-like cAMP-binding protein [Natronoflexus pectinivorans]